jgi:hypothetical protein
MHSNAGPSYHQPSYVLTNNNTPGWIRVNNPHPEYLSPTSNSTSTFNTAAPSQSSNTDLMNNIEKSGVGSNPHIDRAPMHSDTIKAKTQMKAEPNTREETREEIKGEGNAREKGMRVEKGKVMGMERGNGGLEKSEVEVEGRAGNKAPFFDKQTGGWREVEVVDLCGEE